MRATKDGRRFQNVRAALPFGELCQDADLRGPCSALSDASGMRRQRGRRVRRNSSRFTIDQSFEPVQLRHQAFAEIGPAPAGGRRDRAIDHQTRSLRCVGSPADWRRRTAHDSAIR